MKALDTRPVKVRKYLPALRGVFGDWVYYSCLMSLADVASRIKFAEKIVRRSERLSEWIQRELKLGRAREIAHYLETEEQRFFNSLVVAIHGGSPAWHGFGNFRPEVGDIDLRAIPEEVEASVGFLSFDGTEKIFALDGQHRLAGIQEALQKHPELGREELSLILVVHQATKPGRERTRRLFTTLNKTAVPVSKGEIIALDENDIMAITTRYLVEETSYLGDKRIRFSATENLDVGAPEFTTIGNLYDVLFEIFAATSKLKNRALRFGRFDESDTARYKDLANEFFSSLGQAFPPVRAYFEAPIAVAAKVVAKHRKKEGGHVAFRPVGLRIIAEITRILVRDGFSIQKALLLVSRLPVEISELPYRGVIWLPSGRMNPSGRPICRRLLLYMLGRESNPNDLRVRYAKIIDADPAAVHLPRRIA